jgi:Condensation domain
MERTLEIAAKKTDASLSACIAPLSCVQQRVWELERNIRGPYYGRVLHRFRGALSIEILSFSLNEIVRRHEILRTRFPVVKGRPIQLVNPPVDRPLPLIELTSLPERARERAAQDALQNRCEVPFDFTRGPLLYWTLLRLGEDDHVLEITLHHLIFDGSSQEILFREVSALYHSRPSARPYALPELKSQYRHFSIREQQWVRNGGIKPHLEYWQRQMSGELPQLRLPADQPRPSASTYRGSRRELSFSPDIVRELQTLNRSERTTMFMTAIAALTVSLHRWTGQEEMLIGAPIANRTQVEDERLIGPYVNILALRTNLMGCLSFRELLRRVREQTLEAYAHQAFPFAELLRMLWPGKPLANYGAFGEPPLFQVCFQFEGRPPAPAQSPGSLRVEPFNTGQVVIGCDLFLHMVEQGPAFGGYLAFSTDIFNESTGARFAREFQDLLDQIIKNPDLAITRSISSVL